MQYQSGTGGTTAEKPAELGALTKSGMTPGVRPFYSGDPDVMSEHTAGMIT